MGATGSGNFIVQDSFDLRPGGLNQPISGNVLGNDQILCGNIASTYYLLTPMKDATRPLGPGVPYVICSTSSALTTCGNGNSLGVDEAPGASAAQLRGLRR